MLTTKMHLMKRLPAIVVYCSWFMTAPQSWTSAAPPESNSGVRTADAEASPHSNFGDIIQAGARMFGKSPPAEGPDRAHPEVTAKGTSSATARKEAIAALPLNLLSAENRQKSNALLKSVSFYRRLPTVTFPVEPEVYNYFMAHPDAAVSIWRAMKISKLQMWQTGRYDYEADTQDGSIGSLEVLHAAGDNSLIACDGIYKSPLFSKPIEAKSLLFLQTSFSRDAEGMISVSHRADLFVSFPSQTMDVVSKIFSPLTVSMTDRTFTEVSLFLKMISLAMTRRPDWVEQIAGKMDGVADIRKEQVVELSAQMHTAAQKRAIQATARVEPGRIVPHEPARTEDPGHVPTVAPDRRPVGNSSPSEKPAASRPIPPERR